MRMVFRKDCTKPLLIHLTSINQRVGFRLLTKMGTKGAVNFVKLVPIAGGVIGSAIDIGSTILIADNTYNLFIKSQDSAYVENTIV